MPAQPRLYREQGIVLRSYRLGEADRIVSIYTQSSGRVRAVAKGVRRMKSRLGGRLDAFTHVDVLLHAGRELDIVTQADIIARFPRLRAEYDAFTAAAAMADAVERTTPERERNVRMFLLLRGGLMALEAGASDPGLLAHAFLAKATALAGLEPTLRVCVGCGSRERSGMSFSAGGAVCPECLDRSDPSAMASTLDTWSRMLSAEWDDLRSWGLAPPARRELTQLLLGFVQWQLENRFRAFGMLGIPR
jgi:DNA repair protein RecO (recombination protein O)